MLFKEDPIEKPHRSFVPLAYAGLCCTVLMLSSCGKHDPAHVGTYKFYDAYMIGAETETVTELLLHKNGKVNLASITRGQIFGAGVTPVNDSVKGQGTWKSVSKTEVKAKITITDFQKGNKRPKIKNNPLKIELTISSDSRVNASLPTVKGTDGSSYVFNAMGSPGVRTSSVTE